MRRRTRRWKTLTRVLAYADDMLMIAPTDEAVKASSWMFEAYVLATGSKISERAALGPLAQARRSRWLAQKDWPSFKWTSWEWKISYFFFFCESKQWKIKLEIDVGDKLVSSGRFGSNFIVVNVLLIKNVSHCFQPYGSNSLCFSCCPFAMYLRELAKFP